MSTTQPTQNSGLNLLRNLPGQLAALMKLYFDQLLKLNNSALVRVGATTDELAAAQERLSQQRSTLRESTLTAIAGHRSDASKYDIAARADIARRKSRPEPADASEAQLRESRETRSWGRIKPLLDQVEATALPNVVRELAHESLIADDDDSLAALSAELPAYVRMRANDKALADQLVPAVLETMDQAIVVARPAVAAALGEMRELATGMHRLHIGFTYCEHSINQNELEVVIPSWDAKQVDHTVKAGPVDL